LEVGDEEVATLFAAVEEEGKEKLSWIGSPRLNGRTILWVATQQVVMLLLAWNKSPDLYSII
jgi:hypothetical protein